MIKKLIGQLLIYRGLKMTGVLGEVEAAGQADVNFPEVPDEFEGLKLDLTPAELASICHHKGWLFGDKVPTPDDVAEIFWFLSSQLDEVSAEDGPHLFESGRFMLVKSPDSESFYTAALIIGTVDRNIAGEEAGDA